MRVCALVVTVIALVCAMAAATEAQFATGRIELAAVDSTGAVLPGVLVELIGPQAGTFTTGGDGVARVLNLPPGMYVVKATLQGFTEYINKNVPVVAGGNVQLKATLAVGGIQQQVGVSAETPLIDAKKTGTATTVTLEELQNIPSARDPWVILQTVPGIIVDRVNVGGSESGQQSGYQAKGAIGSDNTWNMDGIPITDMAATGSTPTYYDFDMFQEMNVTMGGADMGSATGGVALNFILKSGTNTPHGSTRVYYEDESMQSNNMSKELATALGSPNGKGNRTEHYYDYGFELGLPIIKDRLWAWGSLGETDVKNLTIRQTPHQTILTNLALKVQSQIANDMRASVTYFHGRKLQYGRDASASRPLETTYAQSGSSNFYKGEFNWVVGDNLYLSARGSHTPSGFALQPQGGMDKAVWVDDGGVWHGSYSNYLTDRPQQTLMGDGSYFRGNHEVKFGYSWRRAAVTSTSALSSAVPGQTYYTIHDGYPDLLIVVESPSMSANLAFYQSAWVGDTLTMNRATISAGVRFDWQNDGVLAASLPAVVGFERWLPAITGPEMPKAITWNSFSPRVGINYALDGSRTTQLRGSYAKFASQLGNGASGILGVVQDRYVGFYGRDLNGDRIAQMNEIDTSYVAGWSGFNINNPSDVRTSVNKTGDYNVPQTHEVIAGVDHELFKNVGVSASFTYRYFNNFNWQPRIGVRSPMYAKNGTLKAGPLPDGSTGSTDYYVIPAANVPAAARDGGVEYTGREGYHQRFWGLEIMATKRLSDKWMARFGFSTNDHREYFDNRATSIQDPTPGPASPYIDGGLVIQSSSGSGKSGIYQLLPKYQIIANGLYQAPWGIDLGANLVIRQGFGQPWFRSSVTTTGDYFGNNKNVKLYRDIEDNRLPSVASFDFRVGKQFRIKRTTLNLDFDIFNLFNAGTVLGRQYDYRLTGATGFNQVLEIMNPRIMRIGVRFGF